MGAQLAHRAYSARAVGLLLRPLGRENRPGIQGQVIQSALAKQVQAVAGDQLPGHQHKDLVYVLRLLSRGFQNSKEAVFLSQRAGIFKQDMAFFPQVTLIPWEGEREADIPLRN